ncbi:P2 response regulator binding domain protein [Leptospira interrogans serovar Grippotyphosa str. UI 12769]|uniref:chemotaxis protein CheW n=1 Tax=Leptospira interrogans TaxID=173 RepID=UPI00029762D7|nr:chemotaxis protein CheW [Leptospira interrogans]EKR26874.1 P2 response regulator binding domain protein [Leptospira interrogans serovar Bataviae str. L1111]EKR45095.1 P2 response regulator binding domain protein [Leptospira interrogans serovar Grippotyphosa str. UI 08368]EMN85914.1 P2 response regulator binding domain protein [Leptospira interrogans serovar Grippotyphosa str. UI 12769]QOI35122.1 chemotaxis protein CheA [Leptospira interrogans serovar Icterohaemorrhagiae]
MAGILGEYTELFLEESEDQIEELNANLLKLEADHKNLSIINDIFRAAHSLKSSAAFVGLYNLSDLAHKMENLLQLIRDGKLDVKLPLVNLLFQCFDLIKYVIANVSQGKKIDTPFMDMIQKLDSYEKDPSSFSDVSAPSVSTQPAVVSKPAETSSQAAPPVVKSVEATSLAYSGLEIRLEAEEVKELEEEIRKSGKCWKISVTLGKDSPMKGLRFSLIVQNLKNLGIVYKSIPDLEELEKGSDVSSVVFLFLSSESFEQIKTAANVDMVEFLDVQEYVPVVQETAAANFKIEDDMAASESKVTLKSIKVSSDKLDQLMNNVGELIITNSGFQRIYDDLIRIFGEDQLFNDLKSRIDLINRISKELQSGIMNIRMVQISTVFRRFSRLVRDLSLETGKKVNLVLSGESTELDKKVIDALGEPLLHLIRNSVDHGIETPAERLSAGKSETGTLELNSYQGGSNIMVEIRDDGRGLDSEKILSKAIEKGLVNPTEASNLSEQEIFQFIFQAGFSTAEKITDISGRGVGMNVVNNLIQEFKGKIIINSVRGQGTSFVLSFPQALAIIPSILVLMEEEVYAFPLSEVNETIKIHNDQITTLEGNEIINLRGEVLPIYRLNRIIGLQDKTDREEFPVVIVQYKGRKIGFMVDELVGKHETVIKSLEKNFRNIRGLTGASIMGDGTIIMVLDIPGIVEIASELEDVDTVVHYHLETMRRIGSIHSAEREEERYIQKTTNPTNVYNHKLHDITNRERLKKKKTEKSRDLKRIVAEKEEVFREQELAAAVALSVEMKAPQEKQLPLPVESETQDLQMPPTITSYSSEDPKKPFVSSEEEYRSHITEIALDQSASEDEQKRAKAIIESFLTQKKERTMSVAPSKDFKGALSKEELKKLENVVNTGMMNAGMVLSQLLKKNIDLFIPEIIMNDRDGLAEEIRFSENHFYGLRIRMNGDLNGNLLMMFSRENAANLAKELLGSETSPGEKLTEDAKSVLSEISNIVCSSVMNSISNKAKASVTPSVPEFLEGTFMQVLDVVKPERTKFLSMLTEFNHEGNDLLGVLLFLPDFDELLQLIPRF